MSENEVRQQRRRRLFSYERRVLPSKSSPSASTDNADCVISSLNDALLQDTNEGVRLDVLPISGSSTVKLLQPNDDTNENEPAYSSSLPRWSPGSTLNIRSIGYLTTRKKIPSPSELYDCARVDIFHSPKRVADLASRVQLPSVKYDDDNGEEKRWHSPDVFVFSLSVPSSKPKLRNPKMDGPCFTVTLYLTMKQETRKVLRRITSPGYNKSLDSEWLPVQSRFVAGASLFEDWCRRAPDDENIQARFKLIPLGHNLSELGVPSWMMKYNGKPCLIKRKDTTGFLSSHPDLSAMEFDISFHPFPYPAKLAMHYLKKHVYKKIVGTVGFVIEGRCDDELPEVVVGSTQLYHPDPKTLVSAEDFFTKAIFPVVSDPGKNAEQRNHLSSFSSSSSNNDAASVCKKGRGTLTVLPNDFLRIPGHCYETTPIDADEEVARLLQSELDFSDGP